MISQNGEQVTEEIIVNITPSEADVRATLSTMEKYYDENFIAELRELLTDSGKRTENYSRLQSLAGRLDGIKASMGPALEYIMEENETDIKVTDYKNILRGIDRSLQYLQTQLTQLQP
jgi:hypothetical protein